MRRFMTLLFLCSLALPARAQDALESDPGYVNAQTVEGWFDDLPRIEINVKGVLLEMAVEAVRASADDELDPEVVDLLGKLRAIQVRVFDADVRQGAAVEERTSALVGRLASEGWETVVRVREDGEDVNIQLKTRGDAIAGLVVLVNEAGGESVFINIVGDISPRDVGRLGRALDIDPLKDVPGGP